MDEKSHVGMTQCWFCGEDNSLLLDPRIVGGELRKSLPRKCGVVDMEPCHKCADLMKLGIMLIIVNGGEMDSENERIRRLSAQEKWKSPHLQIPNLQRFGMVVLKESAFKEHITGPPAEFGLKNRWILVDQESAQMLGILPTPDENAEPR